MSRGGNKHRRGWQLARLAAVACVLCGVVAALCGGELRFGFGAASIVFLVTAAYCTAMVGLESSDGAPVDLEAPPAEPPVPQSYITLIHGSGTEPNNSLESDASKATRASD